MPGILVRVHIHFQFDEEAKDHDGYHHYLHQVVVVVVVDLYDDQGDDLVPGFSFAFPVSCGTLSFDLAGPKQPVSV